MVKTLKFRKNLVGLVLSGKKNSTWRLFDDKNLQVNDKLELQTFGDNKTFANAVITKIVEKPFKDLSDEDRLGHEAYKSDEDMYATYSTYYKKVVGPNTLLKIIWFRIIAS